MLAHLRQRFALQKEEGGKNNTTASDEKQREMLLQQQSQTTQIKMQLNNHKMQTELLIKETQAMAQQRHGCGAMIRLFARHIRFEKAANARQQLDSPRGGFCSRFQRRYSPAGGAEVEASGQLVSPDKTKINKGFQDDWVSHFSTLENLRRLYPSP